MFTGGLLGAGPAHVLAYVIPGVCPVRSVSLGGDQWP